jgi:hypothetical protein
MNENDQTTVDPFTLALQDEFDCTEAELAPLVTDEEDMEICKFLRSIQRRKLEIASIKAWQQRIVTLNNQIDGIVAFYGPKIEAIALRRLAHKKKQKFIGTPYGRVKVTTRKGGRVSFASEDKDMLLEWAKQNCPDAVHMSAPAETLRKEALAKACESGMTIPGVNYEGPGDYFSYTVDTKEHEDDGQTDTD